MNRMASLRLTYRLALPSATLSRGLASKAPSSSAPAPTSNSRSTPQTHSSSPPHPGYTPYETPATSADPSSMPPPPAGAVPSSSVAQASTKPHPPHPSASEMATGASSPEGGADAIKPGSERNVKNWGPNARSADFNREEGKRRPVLDGGSNEGKGGSK